MRHNLKRIFNGLSKWNESTGSTLRILGSLLFGFSLFSCAPTAKQLKEAVEKDPSIVFAAIEKDPEKFIEVVNAAAQNAQRKAQQKAMEDETKKRDDEFKNPLSPVVEEGRVIFGNASAPVTIVEYSDFECPFCSKGYQTMKQVKAEYGDKVRVVFKHLPLDFHPKALPAAKYFEALARQGHDKAEKFHDRIFENQGELKSKGDDFLKKVAKDLGADMKRLEKDLQDEALLKRIEADIEEAKKFNISGTPGFVINGVSLKGAYPIADFKEIIDRHLKK